MHPPLVICTLFVKVASNKLWLDDVLVSFALPAPDVSFTALIEQIRPTLPKLTIACPEMS